VLAIAFREVVGSSDVHGPVGCQPAPKALVIQGDTEITECPAGDDPPHSRVRAMKGTTTMMTITRGLAAGRLVAGVAVGLASPASDAATGGREK
jgi:hypothetical protein